MKQAVFLILLCLLSAWAIGQVAHFENPPPTAGFTEDRPDFLYFKDATITKKGKYSFDYDITLYGKIPNNLDDKVTFYIGFDIDNDKSTGGAGINSNFGQDIGVFIYKDANTNRFQESSNKLLYRGKMHELKVTGLKVNDDKISFSLRCELFGYNDAFKVFFHSNIAKYERGVRTSATDVSTIGPKPVVFGKEAAP